LVRLASLFRMPSGDPSRLRWWLSRVLVGTAALAVLLALSGLGFQSIATARDTERYPPSGELVDVGGFRLHLHAAGESHPGPTVVLIGCGGCTSANWGWVHPGVAEFAPVVAVDRAGLGWSEPRPRPGDGRDDAEELHTALHRAGIPGPYVLVGYSYGGPVARIYTAQYPDEVVGLVLLDPRHPDQDQRFPEEAVSAAESEKWLVKGLGWSARFGLLRLTSLGEDQVRDLPPRQRAEYAAHYNTAGFWQAIASASHGTKATDDAARAAGDLGDRPLIVLSADRAWLGGGNAPADEARHRYTEMNEEQSTLSSNSLHIVVEGASHNSLVNNQSHASHTVDAIQRVVEATRHGQSLSD
jgi:pimeloyl-ACP methyl ester carboxylesterase